MRSAAVASLTAVLTFAVATSAVAASARAASASTAENAVPPIPHSLSHVEIPATAYVSARTGAGGGYELNLTAFRMDVPPQNGEPARVSSYVSLQLEKPGAAAYYSPLERRFGAGGSVEAGWGAMGRVKARFVPQRSHRKPVPRCDGFYTIEAGLLVGRLSFRGEGGYAAVRSRAVPATRTRQPEMTCDYSGQAQGEGHESANVGGSVARHGRRLGVTAYEHRALGTLTIYAYSAARRGGVYVTRSVSAVAPLSALALDPEAESATLTAPRPFTGSAVYRAFPGKEAGTWRGDLAVDFPGEPGVRLAGKRFEGVKLKPGECAPDDNHTFCTSAKIATPIAVKPALPLGAARAGLFLMSE